MTIKHLQPKIPGRGDMPSTDRYIGQADMTPWEREYRKYDQMHSYVILSEWTGRDRDFMAYWNLQLQKKLEELGHPSAKPIMAITRWHQPIWRDGQPPGDAPADKWDEYEAETAALWDRLPQDEIDAIRGMTDEDKAAREAFESMTPEQKAEHARAVRASGGGLRSTRSHVDGRILNERGETIGRWDDNEDGIRQWAITKRLDPDAEVEKRLGGANAVPQGLIKRVAGYYESNKDRADRGHGENWLRVLVAFGARQEAGLKPYTAAEARESEKIWSGWKPVREALERLEAQQSSGAAGVPAPSDAAADSSLSCGAQDAEAQLEKALKVINERPDVEVRKYNPDTNTLDVLSPATVTQPVLEIPPEHKDGFIEYLQVEREWARVNNGAYHPVVKHDVFGKMIEMVEAGEDGSDLKSQYDQFLNWMDGRFGQIQADGSIREYKSEAAKAADAQVAQQKALREAIPGDNAALAARTQKILEEAAKDAPTPEDIAAAVAAGDWHAVAALAKAKAKAQVPPKGYVWFGWIRQGSIASGQYICIGDGEYEEAILYLASDFGGTEPKPRLYQQNALNGPCRVKHSHDWNGCRREGPFLKTWEEIRAEYGNI